MQFWDAIVRGVQCGILVAIIFLALFIWMFEKILAALGRHPRAVTGANPVGAVQIVRGMMRGFSRGLTRTRRWLGRYAQNHHPVVYRKTQGIFQ